jgi:hypothetical protein
MSACVCEVVRLQNTDEHSKDANENENGNGKQKRKTGNGSGSEATEARRERNERTHRVNARSNHSSCLLYDTLNLSSRLLWNT